MHRPPLRPPTRLRPPNLFSLLGALGCSAAALAGCAGTPGTGGDEGTGGESQPGGTGGMTSSGAGGAAPAGSGGTTTAGSGGTTVAGTGGRGSGGATATGSGGAATGAGGSGSGGRAGTGGSAPGAGGSVSPGSGGAGGSAPGTGGSTRPVAGLPEYWISPTGLDTNAGTQASPFQSLNQAHNYAAAGSTIWVMPGKYMAVATVGLTKNGTAASPIKITAMSGRPVIDFSLQVRAQSALRGINLSGDYWNIKGIEIANASDNCINIGGSHNTIENVAVHGCGDTGIQITVDSNQAGDATRGANNTILNCDSYDNADTATNGENADGFAAKLYIGPGNVFRGCRAYNNSDDGWDFFAANDVVVIDGCWAFNNGQTSSGYKGPDGDGNGFKLGGKPDSGDANMGGAVHKVTSSFGFDNNGCGFTRNNNPSTPTVSMSGGRNNGKGDFCSLTGSGNVTITMTGAQAKAAARNADGSLPAIR